MLLNKSIGSISRDVVDPSVDDDLIAMRNTFYATLNTASHLLKTTGGPH